MSQHNCAHCGTVNQVDYRFCKRCGKQLAADTQTPRPRGIHQSKSINQMGASGRSLLSIWKPFAGYGKQVDHSYWMLNGLGNRAEDLCDVITSGFLERSIPGADVSFKFLSERGIAAERRPYFLIQRGVATVALYIARFGQNLYVSKATYAQGSISRPRVYRLLVAAFILLVCCVAIGMIIDSGILSPLSAATQVFVEPSLVVTDSEFIPAGAMGVFAFFLFVLAVQKLLELILVFARIIRAYIMFREPWFTFRLPPNEFQKDDILALQKAAEESVRLALDSIGIDHIAVNTATSGGQRRRVI